MSPLPYRYAEKSVYRYIQVLVAVQTEVIPKRLEFHPDLLGVNSETAVCRLRDAAHSLITGLTTHPSIDPTLLKERFRHYRVSHDGTKVFVIPKTEKKQSTNAQVEVSQTVSGTDVLARVKSTEVSALRALALLLGRHFLQGQVEIVGLLDDKFRREISIHDIEITSLNPNLHIMF